MACAPGEDSDQPGLLPSLIRVFAGRCPGGSESSLGAQCVAKDSSFLHADSEVSDQTGWMPRLIRVFAGRTSHFAGFVVRRLICNTSSGPFIFVLVIMTLIQVLLSPANRAVPVFFSC